MQNFCKYKKHLSTTGYMIRLKKLYTYFVVCTLCVYPEIIQKPFELVSCIGLV